MLKNLGVKNLIANSLNQLLGIGFPIIVQSYIIRKLSLTDIGYWNIITSTKSVTILFITFFSIYLINKIASTEDDEELSTVLTNSVVSIYICLLIPLASYLYYLLITYNSLSHIIIVSSIPLLSYPLSLDYYYQGKLKNDFLLYRKLFTKLIFVGLLFVFVKANSDFVIYVYITSGILVLEHLINLFYSRRYICFKNISTKHTFLILKESVPYLPFMITFNVLPHISIVMGDYIYNSKEISVYSIIFKLINLGTTFISSSAMVLFPLKLRNKLSNSKFSDKKYIIATGIVSLVSIIVLIFSKEIIYFLFLDEYRVVGLDLNFNILTTYIFIHSIYNYIVFNKYFANNKVWIVTIINLIIVLVYFLFILYSWITDIKFEFAIPIIVSASVGLLILLTIQAKEYLCAD
jgi:PST family polysaccharide transporter